MGRRESDHSAAVPSSFEGPGANIALDVTLGGAAMLCRWVIQARASLVADKEQLPYGESKVAAKTASNTL